jgi:glycogen operon protein
MLLAGDEFGRTQHGNNNAYCQDNELNWLDWEGIDEDGRRLTEFVRRLIALRQTFPVLRRGRFFTGAWNDELKVKDSTWLAPDGTEMTAEHWGDGLARCMGVVLDGRAQASGIKKPAGDATLFLVVNSYHDVVRFKLPQWADGARWELLIDTNRDEQNGPTPFEFGHEYDVTGRSLLLFALKPASPRGIIRRVEAVWRTLDERPVPIPTPAAENRETEPAE